MTELIANPIAWAALVAVVIIPIMAWRRRSDQPNSIEQRLQRPAGKFGPTRDLSDFIDAPKPDPSDRRHRLRRDGQPVPVHFRLSDVSPPQPALVLDRSKDGLRISLTQSLAMGTSLFLLADHAPAGTQWAQANITWSKPVDGRYELGCQFNEELPWNVLLLFG